MQFRIFESLTARILENFDRKFSPRVIISRSCPRAMRRNSFIRTVYTTVGRETGGIANERANYLKTELKTHAQMFRVRRGYR